MIVVVRIRDTYSNKNMLPKFSARKTNTDVVAAFALWVGFSTSIF